MKLRGKSVAIVAMGDTALGYWRDHDVLGYRKPADKLWTINSAGFWFRDTDVAISTDDLKRDGIRDRGYVEKLTALGKEGVTLITTTVYPEWPGWMRYPLKFVQKHTFGGMGPWLDNSVNYALALAIALRFETISLWGCEFSAPPSREGMSLARSKVKPDEPWWCEWYREGAYGKTEEPGEKCCHMLIGVAMARGIQVRIPRRSTLMDNHKPYFLYGFQKQPKWALPHLRGL